MESILIVWHTLIPKKDLVHIQVLEFWGAPGIGAFLVFLDLDQKKKKKNWSREILYLWKELKVGKETHSAEWVWANEHWEKKYTLLGDSGPLWEGAQ